MRSLPVAKISTLLAVAFVLLTSSQAQTFPVLYSFGIGTGTVPMAGLTMDRGGNRMEQPVWVATCRAILWLQHG